MITELRRWLWPVLLLVALPSGAGELEEAVRAEWQGAWVILETPVGSDCLPCATPNRVVAGALEGVGGHRFAAGEAGQVVAVDVKRKGVELLVKLAPLLARVPAGPFALYEERPCGVKLLVELRRAELDTAGPGALAVALERVAHRVPSETAAHAEASWNGRTAGSPPPDYAATLARYEEWLQGWVLEARAAAVETLDAVLPRDTEASYYQAFFDGAESVRAVDWGRCAELPDLELPSAAGPKSGWGDGRAYAYALSLLHHIDECNKNDSPEE